MGEKPAPGAGYGEGEWTEATQVRKLENSGCQEAGGESAFEEEFVFRWERLRHSGVLRETLAEEG